MHNTISDFNFSRACALIRQQIEHALQQVKINIKLGKRAYNFVLSNFKTPRPESLETQNRSWLALATKSTNYIFFNSALVLVIQLMYLSIAHQTPQNLAFERPTRISKVWRHTVPSPIL